jgi:hypothetical protein
VVFSFSPDFLFGGNGENRSHERRFLGAPVIWVFCRSLSRCVSDPVNLKYRFLPYAEDKRLFFIRMPCRARARFSVLWRKQRRHWLVGGGKNPFPGKLRENLFENNFPEITLLSARDSCPTGIYPKTRDNRRRLIQIKYIPAGTG